jgi:hypothetical protein
MRLTPWTWRCSLPAGCRLYPAALSSSKARFHTTAISPSPRKKQPSLNTAHYKIVIPNEAGRFSLFHPARAGWSACAVRNLSSSFRFLLTPQKVLIRALRGLGRPNRPSCPLSFDTCTTPVLLRHNLFRLCGLSYAGRECRSRIRSTSKEPAIDE